MAKKAKVRSEEPAQSEGCSLEQAARLYLEKSEALRQGREYCTNLRSQANSLEQEYERDNEKGKQALREAAQNQ